jgi:hypothetical protein
MAKLITCLCELVLWVIIQILSLMLNLHTYYCLKDRTRDNLCPIVHYYNSAITHSITICPVFWKHTVINLCRYRMHSHHLGDCYCLHIQEDVTSAWSCNIHTIRLHVGGLTVHIFLFVFNIVLDTLVCSDSELIWKNESSTQAVRFRGWGFRRKVPPLCNKLGNIGTAEQLWRIRSVSASRF